MSGGVVIEGLTKLFGQTAAVDGLSLAVARGESTGLLGPNGARKTTTLRVLAGILAATSGRATVDGVEVGTDAHEAKRRLGSDRHDRSLRAPHGARDAGLLRASLRHARRGASTSGSRCWRAGWRSSR